MGFDTVPYTDWKFVGQQELQDRNKKLVTPRAAVTQERHAG